MLFTFNVAECHSMGMARHFPDNQIQFEQIQSAKYLGITITDNLDCGQHISEISCKATRQCGLIGAIVHWHKVVYKTLFRPHLELAAPIWHSYHKTEIRQVEKMLRTAARWTCRRWRNTSSVGNMLDDLEWLPLEARREQPSLKVIEKQ